MTRYQPLYELSHTNATMSRWGYKVADKFVVGDYELYLLKSTRDNPMNQHLDGVHFQIGLQRSAEDFTNFSDQNTVSHPLQPGFQIKQGLKAFGDKIKEWIALYGEDHGIFFSSQGSDRKTEFYKMILSKAGIPFEHRGDVYSVGEK